MTGCSRLKSKYSVLLCDNLDHSYEALRVQSYIWDIYVWAYSTMNVNEHLSPLVAVNSEGYRKLRPSQGDGYQNIISAKVQSLHSNALGVKKFKYVACRNPPKDPMQNGTRHICVEGLFESKRRRSGNVSILKCSTSGCRWVQNFGTPNKAHWNNVKEWLGKSRASMFRSGLGQITYDAKNDGTQYDPNFDLNAMDD